jgi:hypothetical protein
MLILFLLWCFSTSRCQIARISVRVAISRCIWLPKVPVMVTVRSSCGLGLMGGLGIGFWISCPQIVWGAIGLGFGKPNGCPQVIDLGSGPVKHYAIRLQ